MAPIVPREANASVDVPRLTCRTVGSAHLDSVWSAANPIYILDLRFRISGDARTSVGTGREHEAEAPASVDVWRPSSGEHASMKQRLKRDATAIIRCLCRGHGIRRHGKSRPGDLGREHEAEAPASDGTYARGTASVAM